MPKLNMAPSLAIDFAWDSIGESNLPTSASKGNSSLDGIETGKDGRNKKASAMDWHAVGMFHPL